MIHLGFSGLLGAALSRGRLPSLYPAADTGATEGRGCVRRHIRKPLLKFHPMRTDRLRVSQNAAVLLFEIDTVDIR